MTHIPSRAAWFACVVAAGLLVRTAEARPPPPKVVVFGASWCGPCLVVKEFLTRNSVPFEFLDIDVDANRERFYEASPGGGGIPFILIGDEKLRGCNLSRLAAALARASNNRVQAPAPRLNEEVYGDYGVSWWQEQFSVLRRRLAAHKARTEAMRKNAQYNDELEAAKRMEAAGKILEQALDQLEIDASAVSLPRKYRVYN